MKTEELIKKWLDNELTAEELEKFQQLDEYHSYSKLAEKAKLFKAPNFNRDKAYQELSEVINTKRAQKSALMRFKPFLKIAAVFLTGVLTYTLFLNNGESRIDTLAMEQKSVDLPDASHVELNALSTISFDKKTWSEKREVTLKGEAYFDVEKGSKFDVITSSGIITVVGTEFNIKNRMNYFEVKCFEGKVNVLYKGQTIPLPAGNTLRVVNNDLVLNKTELSHPTWLDKKSSFESVPLAEVIAEFERQYNMKVKIESTIKTDILFTGSFGHDNKENAIKQFAVPFGLDFKISNEVVTLKNIE